MSQRLLPRADGKGRVAAFETMVATNAIRAVIRDDKMHQALSLMEASRGEGMQTMDRALFDLVRTGEVDIEEAARHARSSRQFIDLFEAPPAAPATTGARTAANPAIDPTAKNKNRS